MFCAGLVMAAGLPAAATAEDERAAGAPTSAPALETPGSGQVLPEIQPDTTVQWIGALGILLLLLRGVCRR